MDISQLPCEEFATAVNDPEQAKKIIKALAAAHHLSPVVLAGLGYSPRKDTPGMEIRHEEVMESLAEVVDELRTKGQESKADLVEELFDEIASAVFTMGTVVHRDGVSYDTKANTYWDILKPVLNELYTDGWRIRIGKTGKTVPGTFPDADAALRRAKIMFVDSPKTRLLTLFRCDLGHDKPCIELSVARAN